MKGINQEQKEQIRAALLAYCEKPQPCRRNPARSKRCHRKPTGSRKVRTGQ